MIEDRVVRLIEETNKEAEHKGWCAKELSKNGQARMQKTMAVKTRTTGIDQHESSIAKLAEDLAALAMAAAERDAAMAEAMTVRRKSTPRTRRHWPLLRVLLQPRLTRSLVSGGVRDVDKADCNTLLQDYPCRPAMGHSGGAGGIN